MGAQAGLLGGMLSRLAGQKKTKKTKLAHFKVRMYILQLFLAFFNINDINDGL